MLIDILNSLKIDDTTQTTRIVEKISVIFASLNEVKAELVRATTALRTQELTGQFHAHALAAHPGINRVWDVESAGYAAGRFGWKAEQPTVRQQVAGAFVGRVVPAVGWLLARLSDRLGLVQLAIPCALAVVCARVTLR